MRGVPVVLYTVVPESAVITRLRELSLDRDVLVCPKSPGDLYLGRALRSVLAARGKKLSDPAAAANDRSEHPASVSFNFYGPSTFANSPIAAGGEKATQRATLGPRPIVANLDGLHRVVEQIAADDPEIAEQLQEVLKDAEDTLDRGEIGPTEVEERTKQKLRKILLTAGGTVATSTAGRALWELLADLAS